MLAELERIDLAGENVGGGIVSAVPIRAPVGGWIVGFHVVPGQVVRPQDRAFEIHDLSKVWVKGYPPLTQLCGNPSHLGSWRLRPLRIMLQETNPLPRSKSLKTWR